MEELSPDVMILRVLFPSRRTLTFPHLHATVGLILIVLALAVLTS